MSVEGQRDDNTIRLRSRKFNVAVKHLRDTFTRLPQSKPDASMAAFTRSRLLPLTQSLDEAQGLRPFGVDEVGDPSCGLLPRHATESRLIPVAPAPNVLVILLIPLYDKLLRLLVKPETGVDRVIGQPLLKLLNIDSALVLDAQ